MFFPAVMIFINFVGVITLQDDVPAISTTPSGLYPVYAKNGTKHRFFRSRTETYPIQPTRRSMARTSAELKEFAAICSLTQDHFVIVCSCAILTPFWVVTAGHCITPFLLYIKYGTKYPSSSEGKLAEISYILQHPRYKVVEQDNKGYDVTLVQNDVGLAKTRTAMEVGGSSGHNLIPTLRLYEPSTLINQEIKIMGFGPNDTEQINEELYSVTLKLVPCERADWEHCLCAVAPTTDAKRVCSGDSGGPVLYKNVLIGVALMGPEECSHPNATLPVGASTVLTTLSNYVSFINDTITDRETYLRMTAISQASSYSTYSVLMFENLLFVVMMQ